jgi:hypothetical protein
MGKIDGLAPSGDVAVDYDRRHLALYAALLEADNAGGDWRDAATSLMQLDVTKCDAAVCWRSHIERARWIIGDGLSSALVTFGARTSETVVE